MRVVIGNCRGIDDQVQVNVGKRVVREESVSGWEVGRNTRKRAYQQEIGGGLRTSDNEAGKSCAWTARRRLWEFIGCLAI